MINILFVAGGTGGHVIPALNMADYISERAPHWKISFIGRKNSFEEKLIAGKYDFYGLDIIKSSDIKKLSYYLSIKDALKILGELEPDILVVFGSYITVPIIVASIIKKLPFFLHEQNVIPGRVTKLFYRFSQGVAVSFPETREYFKDKDKIYLTGNFVRTELLTMDKARCKKELGFDENRKLLLITGGSQGSMKINYEVKKIIPYLLNNGWQILHQIGEKNYVSYIEGIPIEEWAKEGYNPVPFIKNMELAICGSDFAISRAGATTIAQFLIAGLPAIYIPYPYAKDNHQIYNAEVVVKVGGGELLLENQLNSEKLINLLDKWDNKDRLAKASEACRKISIANGRENFWNLILEKLEGRN
ncbi:UDP-N-acetylglucosamine--N-acetylmuramyl-(pentapeptide) pyrophosphoryl-undecaprenol N-acetylglucosamine transferase [Dictyoglomus sp.]|jgi:UDP-N-acetylglucosamine--N-acetylmuramyl-(pentapeptide) pyrophosphoryl-undecaprenol N-acetylglucosamine transferase|uniref:UDP-N-acetylglucosamine--N-acetylmuramyl- (pentapeptide) pyrophosphoryl-undecaprenol N-acetylglucosamine transferase n=1 Tax=Dictyoglomus sp. TaxID=28205 RepID=UPI003D0E48C2